MLYVVDRGLACPGLLWLTRGLVLGGDGAHGRGLGGEGEGGNP